MEPAGIEPASESTFPEDATCVVARVVVDLVRLEDRPHEDQPRLCFAPRCRDAAEGLAYFVLARAGTIGGVTVANVPRDSIEFLGSQAETEVFVVGN